MGLPSWETLETDGEIVWLRGAFPYRIKWFCVKFPNWPYFVNLFKCGESSVHIFNIVSGLIRGRVTSSKCKFCLNLASIFTNDYEHTNISLFRNKQHLSFFPSVRTVSPLSTIIISDAAGACSLRLAHFPSKLGPEAVVVPPTLSSVWLWTATAAIVIVSVPMQSKITK